MKRIRTYAMIQRHWDKNGNLKSELLIKIPEGSYNYAMRNTKPLLKHQHGQYWYAPYAPRWVARFPFLYPYKYAPRVILNKIRRSTASLVKKMPSAVAFIWIFIVGWSLDKIFDLELQDALVKLWKSIKALLRLGY